MSAVKILFIFFFFFSAHLLFAQILTCAFVWNVHTPNRTSRSEFSKMQKIIKYPSCIQQKKHDEMQKAQDIHHPEHRDLTTILLRVPILCDIIGLLQRIFSFQQENNSPNDTPRTASVSCEMGVDEI